MSEANLKKLMEINVSNLARTQLNALKEHMIGRLEEIKRLIQEENFDGIEPLTRYSPAGDDMGIDSNYIDFGYDGEPLDILEIAQECQRLKNAASKVDEYERF